jgi:hypothetical protein
MEGGGSFSGPGRSIGATVVYHRSPGRESRRPQRRLQYDIALAGWNLMFFGLLSPRRDPYPRSGGLCHCAGHSGTEITRSPVQRSGPPAGRYPPKTVPGRPDWRIFREATSELVALAVVGALITEASTARKAPGRGAPFSNAPTRSCKAARLLKTPPSCGRSSRTSSPDEDVPWRSPLGLRSVARPGKRRPESAPRPEVGSAFRRGLRRKLDSHNGLTHEWEGRRSIDRFGLAPEELRWCVLRRYFPPGATPPAPLPPQPGHIRLPGQHRPFRAIRDRRCRSALSQDVAVTRKKRGVCWTPPHPAAREVGAHSICRPPSRLPAIAERGCSSRSGKIPRAPVAPRWPRAPTGHSFPPLPLFLLNPCSRQTIH